MTWHSKAVARIATSMMVVVSGLMGFLLVEAAYRLYLYTTVRDWFWPLLAQGPLHFTYFQDSPYRYSEPFGYEYVPGVFNGGYIANGTVQDCYETLYAINALGNSGRIKGSYADAALKVLVFGDSWTSQSNDGLAWPDFLQELLEQQLGLAVHVVNFGRDGYGLLQMFDLAGAKVPQWQPDLVVIAFITDDLRRARFWRMKTMYNGRERMVASITPDPHPDEQTASDVYPMHSQASHAWCHKARAVQDRGDPIVRELETVARQALQRSTLRVRPLSLSQSLVWDQLRHGQPFYKTLMTTRPSQLPRHTMRDFAEDARMVANVKALADTGIPYVLIHLAYYAELKARREYMRVVDLEQDLALVDSLSRLTGRPVYGTVAHVQWPIENLESLSSDFLTDHHPSRRGTQFYAEVVAEILRRHGYVR